VEGNAPGLKLDLRGAAPNVRLQISDISRKLLADIPDILIDLLEVASYVYAADSAIPRGGKVDAQMGKRWRRNFRFVIPVRLPDLWSSSAVASTLVETLSFLSDDSYKVEFQSLANPTAVTEYFRFAEEAAFKPDEVILFSGGMDSFAGAVEELAVHGRRVALVSHRSASKIAGAQKHLVDQLRKRFGASRALHVPVWAQVDSAFNREPTHRTRSFLFAALGAVTARLFGKDGIRMYENGVVSLNLPPVAQVVGARATRTTHPQVLAGFRRLLLELLGRPFDVENPFAWLTKAEVVERISANGCGDLIRDTRSCIRVRDMTKLRPHCGQCSQCIDRRFAVLAAGQEHEDPAEAYEVDLFSEKRPPGPDREMALAFVRSASRIRQMEDVAFFAYYGEASRVVEHFAEPADMVSERILDLHRRHASSICRVFDEAISRHASALREGSMPADCLLSLIVSRYGASSTYPAPSREFEHVPTIGPGIRMAVDEKKKRVVFDGWGEVRGKNAELLIALAAPFREATRKELAPENFPFIKAASLRLQINCPNEQTFRRRILRCRKSIDDLAMAAGGPLLPIEAVIENSPWHGYRLNPDRVRIVALPELGSNGT
jgi:7-cyano-7-deazaguanine synthase in queuosine biosynthesis